MQGRRSVCRSGELKNWSWPKSQKMHMETSILAIHISFLILVWVSIDHLYNYDLLRLNIYYFNSQQITYIILYTHRKISTFYNLFGVQLKMIENDLQGWTLSLFQENLELKPGIFIFGLETTPLKMSEGLQLFSLCKWMITWVEGLFNLEKPRITSRPILWAYLEIVWNTW